VSRPNPPEAWITTDVPDLRIIDDPLWQKVKKRQGQTRFPTGDHHERGPFWLARRPANLLSGLVRCGQCGGAMTQIGRDYLGCSNRTNKGTCENRHIVRRGRIEAPCSRGFGHACSGPTS
jgi:hypothetical protein